jgi:CHASE3 domain sensor protein
MSKNIIALYGMVFVLLILMVATAYISKNNNAKTSNSYSKNKCLRIKSIKYHKM